MKTSIFMIVLFCASSVDAQLTRIGAAAAVRGTVSAVAPGQTVGRIMSSGKEVYLRDAVTTDAQGRMQVMLLDETVFTIGPNSSLVLDEFVYDPGTGAGKMTARVTKGVFRFVTGKIARETPSNMRVKLPVGVIGIRGTIVMG
ncbi:MAG: FecR domain-containing protein, partial [Elusimicrobia bacterium]|nr:FecR domain-containing protein [Elusimicrobiota bacterium]